MYKIKKDIYSDRHTRYTWSVVDDKTLGGYTTCKEEFVNDLEGYIPFTVALLTIGKFNIKPLNDFEVKFSLPITKNYEVDGNKYAVINVSSKWRTNSVTFSLFLELFRKCCGARFSYKASNEKIKSLFSKNMTSLIEVMRDLSNYWTDGENGIMFFLSCDIEECKDIVADAIRYIHNSKLNDFMWIFKFVQL